MMLAFFPNKKDKSGITKGLTTNVGYFLSPW
jgi:hypothetical protein